MVFYVTNTLSATDSIVVFSMTEAVEIRHCVVCLQGAAIMQLTAVSSNLHFYLL